MANGNVAAIFSAIGLSMDKGTWLFEPMPGFKVPHPLKFPCSMLGVGIFVIVAGEEDRSMVS